MLFYLDKEILVFILSQLDLKEYLNLRLTSSKCKIFDYLFDIDKYISIKYNLLIINNKGILRSILKLCNNRIQDINENVDTRCINLEDWLIKTKKSKNNFDEIRKLTFIGGIKIIIRISTIYRLYGVDQFGYITEDGGLNYGMDYNIQINNCILKKFEEFAPQQLVNNILNHFYEAGFLEHIKNKKVKKKLYSKAWNWIEKTLSNLIGPPYCSL